MRRAYLVAGALAAAATAAAVALGVHARSAPKQTVRPAVSAATTTATAAPGRGPMACAVGAGARLAFDVALATDLEVSGAGLSPGSRRAATGRADRIHASSVGRVDAVGLPALAPGESLVALRFSSLASEPSEPPELAGSRAQVMMPVLVRLGAGCRIAATARRKDVAAVAYQRVLAMLDRVDFEVRATGGAAATWTASHRDEYGTFVASYTAEGARIERRRLRYLRTGEGRDELHLDYIVHQAHATVRLGNAGWFDELVERTDIEAKSNGQTPLRDRSTVRWTATSPDADAFAGFDLRPEDYTWGRPSAGELQDDRTALVDGRQKGVSFADAWRAYRAAAADKTPGAWHRAQKSLRAWMRLNPEGVRAVARELRNGRQTSAEKADLVLALAKSGSEVAAAELRALASDAGVDENTRVQATSALADLDHATVADVRTLASLAARNGASAHDLVGSTATMTIGSLLEGVNEGEVVTAARAALDGPLASSDPAAQSEALWAVGNSGDTHFTEAVVRASASADDGVRSASARAVRGMPPATANPVLDGLVRSDQSAEVVKEAAQAQRQVLETYGTALSPEQVTLYRTKLPSAPVAVRWEILRLLGEAAKLQPAARSALVWWYPQETVNQNKVLIGTYLKTADLD